MVRALISKVCVWGRASTNTSYLSFRAPLVPATNRAFALVVPLTNMAELVTSGGPALFGDPILLNLGCRGVRSIEGDTNGYILVAGNVDNVAGPNAFRFFTWTGLPGDVPQLRGGDFLGLNPEAIVALPPAPWTDESLIQVVSDNGRALYYGDSVIAKRQPYPEFKKFRADWIRLGAPSEGRTYFARCLPVGVRFAFYLVLRLRGRW